VSFNLDRIYRIIRILFQFPEETEKPQSTFSGIKKAFWHPRIPASRPSSTYSFACPVKFFEKDSEANLTGEMVPKEP
jgi:hypothetical protein